MDSSHARAFLKLAIGSIDEAAKKVRSNSERWTREEKR